MDSAKAHTFYGIVEGGKLRLEERDAFARLIRMLDGQPIKLTLGKVRQKRTLNQNAYYWAIVVPALAEHCGYEIEEMHEALRRKFLSTHLDDPLPTVGSTSKLDTAQFSAYLESVIRLGAEMGCDIPDAERSTRFT